MQVGKTISDSAMVFDEELERSEEHHSRIFIRELDKRSPLSGHGVKVV